MCWLNNGNAIPGKEYHLFLACMKNSFIILPVDLFRSMTGILRMIGKIIAKTSELKSLKFQYDNIKEFGRIIFLAISIPEIFL